MGCGRWPCEIVQKNEVSGWAQSRQQQHQQEEETAFKVQVAFPAP